MIYAQATPACPDRHPQKGALAARLSRVKDPAPMIAAPATRARDG